jgi:uncharacterized protein YdhG (YjbR/CyaY superfamily)
VPKLEPFIHSGMLAYGREAKWFRIGVASNANAISLYVPCAESVVERYKEALPKARLGKCCVRFKRMSDLDQAALKKLIREGGSGS